MSEITVVVYKVEHAARLLNDKSEDAEHVALAKRLINACSMAKDDVMVLDTVDASTLRPYWEVGEIDYKL